MKFKYIVLFALLSFYSISIEANVLSSQDTLKYRVYLTDKGATKFSLKHPEEYLSQKSIARRAKQHLAIDSTDLPVCDKYINAIRKTGVKIVAKGKWNNFVTVSCNDIKKIDKIKQLKFVRDAELVWEGKGEYRVDGERDSLQSNRKTRSNVYGNSLSQIKQCNGVLLHEAGFKGKGMEIAIIDEGFHNVDHIKDMSNIQIIGSHDFIYPCDNDIFAMGRHGTAVLSIMGINCPFCMMGSAPEASYLLLRSEDSGSETPVEQDYWSEAIEYADSVGVDMVNSSLGYYSFDNKSMNVRYRDLDGKTALISRQASMAADKGMLVVVSAGNAGMGSWKKISVPADADNILTVGAVNIAGELANFSSIGNTADGRIKPDVVADGVSTAIVDGYGYFTYGNGTSFSSPLLCGLVACLWQACPNLTAKQVIDIVRKSGDRAAFPDNIYGYGIPDMWKAYQLGKSLH
jgi:subtilisin family serine protease